MSDDRTARINTAVDAILDCCMAGPQAPLAMLPDCLDRLTADSPFSDEDREIIEQAVLRQIMP